MLHLPLTPTEQDDLLAILHAHVPDAARWRLAPPEPGDRGLLLCGPAGMRLVIEIPWQAPARLQVSGLLPASPAGAHALSPTQTGPAITVARARGVQALATAIVRRLLPRYQPLLQAAQARTRAHRDAVARQAATATRLAQVPGCTARHTPGRVGIAGTGPEAAAIRGQATVTLEGNVALTLHGLSPEAAWTLLTALHLAPRTEQGPCP